MNESPVQKSPLVYLLMAGHICVDMAQGGIAAVIPFLVVQQGFNYAEAGMLVFAANIASAVIQPLFGWMGDRHARPWLMGLGVLLSGLGLTGIGVLESYGAVVAASLVSGIGNAMLHPEGGRLAYLVGGDFKAESMSVFSVGGQIGFCVGPVLTVAAVTAFGLPGMAVYFILSVPVAVVMFGFNARFRSYGLRPAPVEGQERQPDRWGAFSLVLGTCSARSIIFYGVTGFVPLMIMANFGSTEAFASGLITLFAAMGAVATALSGKAARFVKTPHLMVGCFVLLALTIAAFIVSGSLALCIALLLAIAVGTNLFNPPSVALGQSFLPGHLGTASGLMFGVAVAVGGVASPILGTLGDAVGLSAAMWVLVGIALMGIGLSLAVVRIERRS